MICLLILILIQNTISLILGELSAICIMKTAKGDKKGIAVFHQRNPNVPTLIEGKFTGMPPNSKRAFHIQEYGDLSHYCMNTGRHYNPYGRKHGNISDQERHIGDIGNIDFDNTGNGSINIYNNIMTLRGDYSVIGRTCVLHDMEDDFGRGTSPDSQINGHAGGRYACGIIGWARNNITIDDISFENDANFEDKSLHYM